MLTPEVLLGIRRSFDYDLTATVKVGDLIDEIERLRAENEALREAGRGLAEALLRTDDLAREVAAFARWREVDPL